MHVAKKTKINDEIKQDESKVEDELERQQPSPAPSSKPAKLMCLDRLNDDDLGI